MAYSAPTQCTYFYCYVMSRTSFWLKNLFILLDYKIALTFLSSVLTREKLPVCMLSLDATYNECSIRVCHTDKGTVTHLF